MAKMKVSWFAQLGRCYAKGYKAYKEGVSVDQCPYRHGNDGNGASQGGNVQRQRQSNWLRGWERASQGLPLDDSNG